MTLFLLIAAILFVALAVAMLEYRPHTRRRNGLIALVGLAYLLASGGLAFAVGRCKGCHSTCGSDCYAILCAECKKPLNSCECTVKEPQPEPPASKPTAQAPREQRYLFSITPGGELGWTVGVYQQGIKLTAVGGITESEAINNAKLWCNKNAAPPPPPPNVGSVHYLGPVNVTIKEVAPPVDGVAHRVPSGCAGNCGKR